MKSAFAPKFLFYRFWPRILYQDDSLIRVYSITSEEWIRDLVPREEAPLLSRTMQHFENDTFVAGGKDLVAAVTWDKFVTVWSTKGDMDCEASYYPTKCVNCQKTDCRGNGTIFDDIKVTPHGKIVLLAVNSTERSTSLLIMKKSYQWWHCICC